MFPLLEKIFKKLYWLMSFYLYLQWGNYFDKSNIFYLSQHISDSCQPLASLTDVEGKQLLLFFLNNYTRHETGLMWFLQNVNERNDISISVR